MESALGKKTIHHGHNIMLGRTWKGITQEGLGHLLNMAQSQISRLEDQQTIDEEMLDKIAYALDVPVDFLKNFQPDQILKTFIQNEPKIDITSNDSSSGIIGGQAVDHPEQTINYNYPIDKVVEMYDRLIKEKDEQTTRFEKQIIDLVKQVEELKARIK